MPSPIAQKAGRWHTSAMSYKWLPNALTIARCVFAGLVLWGIWQALLLDQDLARLSEASPAEVDVVRLTVRQQLWYQFALLGFLSGALTDFLDGWAARKFDAQSRFGVWLDPIADKLLVGAALLGLAMILKSWFIYIPAAAIIARDVFMTWLRTTPAGKVVVDPSNLAKWKTGFEMVAIIGLMLPLALSPVDLAPDVGGTTPLAFQLGAGLLVGLLWVAAALSLLTGWRYVRAARA
ncbi:CDP-alcohol phosphatidyltransferase family protein [Hyphomonas johnsonii]|uniref:CDP-diacylglycerol--glycerol-3-phosphate 3-phosphatidyltransferase n=1 Tax=Hyphomonas johnsonii MHS-2 TaxID=1280950 RepID=A0A059FJM2_9PROT|nr:CDP-alcohol phosphatidyltransferase family protein [Hyphomonas johnsonii]KCZ90731.1 CDP-diacylglycerol--glycerol-3-phosphate 3-phosphatidyltransferase [Hyphomonas johnsonii MHS-2]